MSAVTDHIDAHFEETIARLKRWASQPSISTEKLGIEEMCALAAADLREFRVRGNGLPYRQLPHHHRYDGAGRCSYLTYI